MSTRSLSSQDPDNRPARLSELEQSRLNYLQDRQDSCQTYNSEIAKWILASLFVLNAGPFAALGKDDAPYNAALAATAHYFVVALGLALTCGFMAWLNTGTREAAISYEVGQMFAPNQSVASNIEWRRKLSINVVRATFGGAVLTGFASLIIFFLGAYRLASKFQGIVANPH